MPIIDSYTKTTFEVAIMYVDLNGNPAISVIADELATVEDAKAVVDDYEAKFPMYKNEIVVLSVTKTQIY